MKAILIIVLCVATVTCVMGCETWHGAGRDVQSLGQKMSD